MMFNQNTYDMLRAMQEISGKTDSSYQKPLDGVPPPPPLVAEHLNSGHEQAAGASILVEMTYKSLSGNMKKRDILIRRVINSKGELYINGLATDIKAPRLIKVSNIVQIHDVGTGRFYDNPFEFVQQKLGVSVDDKKDSAQSVPHSDFEKVIERTAPAMTVMMYLSGLDGERSPAERQKIVDHVRARTKDLHYTDQELNDYLISLAPDYESFKLALQRVISKDKSVIQLVVEGILSVITADDKVDEKERAVLSQIMSLLEQEGFEFHLPA